MGALSGPEAETAALLIPAHRESGPLEAVRRQLDRLMALQDGLDDVRRQEGEREGAADFALVPVIPRGKLAKRSRAPLDQIVKPGMSISEQQDELRIWRPGSAVR